MQQSLFIQVENRNTDHDIVRIVSPKATLTKEQKSFNRLSRKVEALRITLEEKREKMGTLASLHNAQVEPWKTELAKLKIEFCHLLDENRKGIKLTLEQGLILDEIIRDFLSEAINEETVDEATEQLFNNYHTESLSDSIQSSREDLKEFMSAMFYERFGLEIDPADLGPEADVEQLVKDLQEQWEQKNQKKPGRKTRKQLEKEELEKQKEALKSKSLRSVYVSLAKILHPDIEANESIRLEKEELMKEVTTAYESRDLLRLLSLEIQLVQSEESNLSGMAADKLSVYEELLREQVKNLEAELDLSYVSPPFINVMHFRFINLHEARLQIMREAKEFESTVNDLRQNIAALKEGKRISTIIREWIREYSLDL